MDFTILMISSLCEREYNILEVVQHIFLFVFLTYVIG